MSHSGTSTPAPPRTLAKATDHPPELPPSQPPSLRPPSRRTKNIRDHEDAFKAYFNFNGPSLTELCRSTGRGSAQVECGEPQPSTLNDAGSKLQVTTEPHCQLELTSSFPRTPGGNENLILAASNEGTASAPVNHLMTDGPKKESPGMNFDSTFIHFENKFMTTCLDFTSSIERYSVILAAPTPDIPDEIHDEIRSALGQAQLLMDNKLKQFSGLIFSYLNKIEDPGPVLPCDLDGWWAMAAISIDQVKGLFDKLEELAKNNWIMKIPEVVTPKSRTPPSPAQTRLKTNNNQKQNPGSAALRALMANNRAQLQLEKGLDAVTSKLKTSDTIPCTSAVSKKPVQAPISAIPRRSGTIKEAQERNRAFLAKKKLDAVGTAFEMHQGQKGLDAVTSKPMTESAINESACAVPKKVMDEVKPNAEAASTTTIATKDAPKKENQGMNLNSTYFQFRGKWMSTCTDFSVNIAKYSAMLAKPTRDIPDDTVEEIRSALEQADMLMGSKLKQFSKLLHLYLHKIEDPDPVRPCDLDDKWNLATISIDQVKGMFDKLEELAKNNWIIKKIPEVITPLSRASPPSDQVQPKTNKNAQQNTGRAELRARMPDNQTKLRSGKGLGSATSKSLTDGAANENACAQRNSIDDLPQPIVQPNAEAASPTTLNTSTLDALEIPEKKPKPEFELSPGLLSFHLNDKPRIWKKKELKTETLGDADPVQHKDQRATNISSVGSELVDGMFRYTSVPRSLPWKTGVDKMELEDESSLPSHQRINFSVELPNSDDEPIPLSMWSERIKQSRIRAQEIAPRKDQAGLEVIEEEADEEKQEETQNYVPGQSPAIPHEEAKEKAENTVPEPVIPGRVGIPEPSPPKTPVTPAPISPSEPSPSSNPLAQESHEEEAEPVPQNNENTSTSPEVPNLIVELLQTYGLDREEINKPLKKKKSAPSSQPVPMVAGHTWSELRCVWDIYHLTQGYEDWPDEPYTPKRAFTAQ